MSQSRNTKVFYWITTVVIFLFEGVMPALTSHTELAIEGVRHLGYPDYFRLLLVSFKVAGALALILPFVHNRIKEWAYAGFAFTMLSAMISHWVVDGLGMQTLMPIIFLIILLTSYYFHHKLVRDNTLDSKNMVSSTKIADAWT